MNRSRQPRIVVGVSGSRASAGALAWAAREGQKWGGHVHAVLVWQPEKMAAYAVHSKSRDHDQERLAACSLLIQALHDAFGPNLPPDLSAELIEGMAERVLVESSLGAQLLVLGSASAPDVTCRSIGPVIRSCLGHAHCPVVVVGPEGHPDFDPDVSSADTTHAHAA